MRRFCWGNNLDGSCGTGNGVDGDIPIAQVMIPEPVEEVYSTYFPLTVSGALTTAGNVFMWGQGAQGLMGNGLTTASNPVPLQVTFFTSAVSMFRVGVTTACASWDGRIYCWGTEGAGDLDLGQAALPGLHHTYTPRLAVLPTHPLAAVVGDPDDMCLTTWSVLVLKDGAL